MIVRDVAPYITECLQSILPYVNELVVVDTGSKDETDRTIYDAVKKNSRTIAYKNVILSEQSCFLKDEAESFADCEEQPPATSYSGQLLLADYGRARQLGWEAATSDYVMWIDSDDIVQGAEQIPQILLQMRERKLNTALMEYDYEQDEDGNSLCRLYRVRIAERGFTKWNQRIHEYLYPIGDQEIFNQTKIVHRAHKLTAVQKRAPLRNYKILLREHADALKENRPVNERIWYYLGQESRIFDVDKALKWFEKYTNTTAWGEERAQAHVFMGQLLEGKGDLLAARAHYATASVVHPDKPESHFGLARIAAYMQEPKIAIRHHEQGEVAVALAKDIIHYNPYDRLYYPSLFAGRLYLDSDQPKKALKQAAKGLAINPIDIQLKGIKHKAESRIAAKYRPRTIAIWTGPALERWTPDNINTTGIGGSETAAVHMAKQLTLLGHKVTVYSDLPVINTTFAPIMYDGVPYVHYDAKDAQSIEADLFISSRKASVLDVRKVSAGKKILWMHDNHVGPSVPKVAGNLLKYDLILGVSRWHKDRIQYVYPFIHPDKILATRNGIDPMRFQAEPRKVGNKMIFSSSPDRGLTTALDFLPEIRKEVPDAELHVFYGFENIDKLAKHAEMQEAIEEMENLKKIVLETPGVIYRGRVSQRVIAETMLESKIWMYPTHFEESSCITGMEAQAAACTPVTTALGALNETIHHGFMFKPPSGAPSYKKAFIDRTIKLLRDEPLRSSFSNEGRLEALKIHPWAKVAEEWDEIIARLFW